MKMQYLAIRHPDYNSRLGKFGRVTPKGFDQLERLVLEMDDYVIKHLPAGARIVVVTSPILRCLEATSMIIQKFGISPDQVKVVQWLEWGPETGIKHNEPAWEEAVLPYKESDLLINVSHDVLCNWLANQVCERFHGHNPDLKDIQKGCAWYVTKAGTVTDITCG